MVSFGRVGVSLETSRNGNLIYSNLDIPGDALK